MTKIQRKRQIRNRVIYTTLILGVSITSIFAVSAKANTRTYAVASEKCNNGMHYEYYTDVETEITSVDIDTQTVHITYKGKDYAYKAKGNIKTQGKIIVTFNEAMQIVNIK